MHTCNYMHNFLCVFFCTSCAIKCTENIGGKNLKYWKSQSRLGVAIYNTYAQNKLTMEATKSKQLIHFECNFYVVSRLCQGKAWKVFFFLTSNVSAGKRSLRLGYACCH